MKIIQELLEGATPSIDCLIDSLGCLLPWLRDYETTPQDPEWHGEGNVKIHTEMVLKETYNLLQTEAKHLDNAERVSLIMGALLHDIAKPTTTKQQEINGRLRTVAPNHASIGRSYLALKLMELGLDYEIVDTALGLVGYHHEPKQLVIKDKPAGAYQRLARLTHPELLYWLELADIRGRYCPDKQQQLDYIEMYRLFAQEYCAWKRYGTQYQSWRAYFESELASWSPETRDFVFANAIRHREAGTICCPEEELARSYSYRESFPQVVLTFGVSGSGKSTWIARHLSDYEIISLDSLRQSVLGDRSIQKQNSKIVAMAKEKLKLALRSKSNVVWDATNLRRDFRQQVVQIARKYGALVTLVVFHCPESSYASRNQQRRHSIPSGVLRKQLEILEFPEIDEADRVVVVDAEGQILARHGYGQ